MSSAGVIPMVGGVVGNGLQQQNQTYSTGQSLPLPSIQTFQPMQRITPQGGVYNAMQGIQRTQFPQQNNAQGPMSAPYQTQGGK